MPDVLSNAVVVYLYSNLACVQVRRFSSSLRVRMSESSFRQPAAISYWNAIKANGYRYLDRLDLESKRLAVHSEQEYKRLRNAIGSSERALERAKRDGEMAYANWLVSASRVLIERLKRRGFIKHSQVSEPAASKVVIESRMFSSDDQPLLKEQVPPRQQSNLKEQVPPRQQSKWDDTSVENTEVSNFWNVIDYPLCQNLSLRYSQFNLFV